MKRRALVGAGLGALLVAGVLVGCGYAGPSVGWSPYPGTDDDSGWTPYGPTVTDETVDPSVVTFDFTTP